MTYHQNSRISGQLKENLPILSKKFKWQFSAFLVHIMVPSQLQNITFSTWIPSETLTLPSFSWNIEWASLSNDPLYSINYDFHPYSLVIFSLLWKSDSLNKDHQSISWFRILHKVIFRWWNNHEICQRLTFDAGVYTSLYCS